jgi:hypothetical protein
VDLATREILTVVLTGNGEDDAAAGSRMLQGHAHRIKSFKGGGAYDRFGFREISGGDVQQVIPPLKNAAVRLPKKEDLLPAHPIQRNETVMFRYKTIFEGELKARTAANQTAEIMLKCLLLNTFRETGIPDSYKVA